MRYLLVAIIFYFGFSFELEWLQFQIMLNAFLFAIGLFGYDCASKTLQKKVFVALMIDAIINMLRNLILGCEEPFFIAPLCNALPVGYLIYCYFIYGNR